MWSTTDCCVALDLFSNRHQGVRIQVHCLAKAVHSLARIRFDNCHSVRPSVRPSLFLWLVQHLMVIQMYPVSCPPVYDLGVWSSCANRNIFLQRWPLYKFFGLGVSRNISFWYSITYWHLLSHHPLLVLHCHAFVVFQPIINCFVSVYAITLCETQLSAEDRSFK